MSNKSHETELPANTRIHNVKITSTRLGLDPDAGFAAIICWIGANSTKGSCAFYCGENENIAMMIKKILDAVGVDTWERLSGRLVRVMQVPRDPNSIAGRRGNGVDAIGHIIEEKWCVEGNYDPGFGIL